MVPYHQGKVQVKLWVITHIWKKKNNRKINDLWGEFPPKMVKKKKILNLVLKEIDGNPFTVPSRRNVKGWAGIYGSWQILSGNTEATGKEAGFERLRTHQAHLHRLLRGFGARGPCLPSLLALWFKWHFLEVKLDAFSSTWEIRSQPRHSWESTALSMFQKWKQTSSFSED